jgi:uncharacterized protein (DUF927 family)
MNDKLPPRTGIKRKTVKKAAASHQAAAGNEGERIATVAPFFGLQVRNLGAATSILGVILLVIGGISFGVSGSKKSADVATDGMKVVMWSIIGFGCLIFVVAAIALAVMVSQHGFR